MTEREAAMCDLSFAHGMKAAMVMLAQGADDKARSVMERLQREALSALRRGARTETAMLLSRHEQ